MTLSSLKVNKVFADGRSETEEILCAEEHLLEIYVNHILFYRLTCTEKNLTELVAGRLLSEGVIDDKSEISEINFCESKKKAFVSLACEIETEKSEKAEATCCTSNLSFMEKSEKNLTPLKKTEWKTESIGRKEVWSGDSIVKNTFYYYSYRSRRNPSKGKQSGI